MIRFAIWDNVKKQFVDGPNGLWLTFESQADADGERLRRIHEAKDEKGWDIVGQLETREVTLPA